jgi:hypothetical protein
MFVNICMTVLLGAALIVMLVVPFLPEKRKGDKVI